MAYIDIDTMAPLPVAKLASLVVKTAAKPLAKRLKKDFARVPLGRASLIKVGQATNQVTTRMAIWAEGFKVRSVPPLNEEKALSEGADLLGETIVLVVSGGVVIWEYNRNSENARQKEEKRLREIEEESDALEAQLYSLDKRLEALEKVVKANSNSLLGLGGKRYVEPDMEDLALQRDGAGLRQGECHRCDSVHRRRHGRGRSGQQCGAGAAGLVVVGERASARPRLARGHHGAADAAVLRRLDADCRHRIQQRHSRPAASRGRR